MQNPLFRPVVEVIGVETFVIAGAFALAAIMFSVVRDTITTNVLWATALKSVPLIILGALVVAVFTAAAAWWTKLGRGPNFQRFGGLATGGAFAALFVAYSAVLSADVTSTSLALKNAQGALLAVVAERHKTGAIPHSLSLASFGDKDAGLTVTSSQDGTVLSATSSEFAGKLVAEGEKNPIDIYWDQQRGRRAIGTVYQGTLEHSDNGDVNVLTNSEKNGKIPVHSSVSGSTLQNGTRVFALVPENKADAPLVIPVQQLAGLDNPN